MSVRTKFALSLTGLFLLVIGIVAAGFASFWFDLSPQEQARALELLSQQRIVILVIFALILLGALAVIVSLFFKSYVHPSKLLTEETQLILSANPGHRIKPPQGPEARELAGVINAFADKFQALQTDVEQKIRAAKADLEEEKNRLAALMSELTQSVLVCNIEGKILLYNNRARQLFSQAQHAESTAGGIVGLGRSIFGILDRNLIMHALENLSHRLSQDNPVSQFVTTTEGGQFIKVQMAPVLGASPGQAPGAVQGLIGGANAQITGLVLTMDDVTRTMETSARRDVLLQSLTEGTRASLATIRAAIETLIEYPEMSVDRRNNFSAIIESEAVALSTRLDATMSEFAEYLKTQWPLEEMLGTDLISAIQRKLKSKLGVDTSASAPEQPLWLKVESYSVAQAMIFIMSRLKTLYDIREATLRLEPAARFARFDMVWKGASIDTETLRAWEQEPLVVAGEGIPLTLQQVAERHGGEAWCHADAGANITYFRLLLPVTEPETAFSARVSREARPEYYDFDLFHQPGQNPELDRRLLTELSYTVFDTETTGLNPSQGDEIISIGAVRIVNGRLLLGEVFEQLIDPRRSLSEESIAIHGITPQMLTGKPAIEQVLPAFYRFAEDTVLVAHNAAFDMRFLQMKEAQTGIKFGQPVLDTLLLSPVIHPNQEAHALEAIAERLGVPIVSRHSASADARVTGEVFLKMIGLLNQQGIFTLRDAREAAEKTYYARIKY
jgi:DNA polymerase-3 subunit epsilon